FVPGTALLAFMLQSLASRQRALELESVRWLRPARASESTLALTLRASQRASAGMHLEINDGRAPLCAADALECSEPRRWRMLLANLSETTAECYEGVVRRRLAVGHHWHCVGAMRHSASVYRVELRPINLEGELAEWPWHPALVDAALLPVQLSANS